MQTYSLIPLLFAGQVGSSTVAAPKGERPPVDFFAQSDFVDTRVTFALSNVNVFAGPGERTTPTSGYRIGVDPNFNLFLENVNTRFSGFESLSHLVLYKRMPSFWKQWETEAGLAALVLARPDTGELRLFDSGTYLRIIRNLGSDEFPEGSIDLTAWPVSSDRFRLGYTYLITWGGTAIFPGKLQSKSITEGAVPGVRLRYRGASHGIYAFLGFKNALLLSRETGAVAGEQVPNYGVLGGGGGRPVDGLMVEANGGFFQKGSQPRPGLEGRRIQAYGASGRVTAYDGIAPSMSADLQLYTNDPTAPQDYLLVKPYKPGGGWSLSVEGSLLAQNLEDPEQFGSERLVKALSAGAVGMVKLDEHTIRVDAFYQSPDFILFNVPGFVPFQASPLGAKTSPEFFAALTYQYNNEEYHLLPSLSVGVKMPATYRGTVPAAQGQNVGGAAPGELRTQVIVDARTRDVLPPDTDATPIVGALLRVPIGISPSMALSGEVRAELNDNQPRIAQDNERGEVVPIFDDPLRLGFALVLQARW